MLCQISHGAMNSFMAINYLQQNNLCCDLLQSSFEQTHEPTGVIENPSERLCQFPVFVDSMLLCCIRERTADVRRSQLKILLSTCLAHRSVESPPGSYTQIIPSLEVNSRHIHRHGLPPSLPTQLLQVQHSVKTLVVKFCCHNGRHFYFCKLLPSSVKFFY